MPVESCQSNNKPGFRWGSEGTCYTYTSGSDRSRDRARNKAERQGKAIEASKSEE